MNCAALNYVGIDSTNAFYWCAVINGILVAPLMAVMLVISLNKQVMGGLTVPLPMLILGWIATLVMAAVAWIFRSSF